MCQAILVRRQHVDQNAFLAQSAVKMRHVSIRDALIHAQEHVALMLDVQQSTTIQYVTVRQGIQAIRSDYVKRSSNNHLNRNQLIRVNRLHVAAMLNADPLVIHLHVRVCRTI